MEQNLEALTVVKEMSEIDKKLYFKYNSQVFKTLKELKKYTKKNNKTILHTYHITDNNIFVVFYNEDLGDKISELLAKYNGQQQNKTIHKR